MKRTHGLIAFTCLGLLLGALWLLYTSRSPEHASPSNYDDDFRERISRELQLQSERRRELPSEQRRAMFDQQQQDIKAIELQRRSAAHEAYKQDKARAWRDYYHPLPECEVPRDPAIAAACQAAQARARNAFELFYDPGEVELR